jgi:transcriptional regulator with XRE-family HTH domain
MHYGQALKQLLKEKKVTQQSVADAISTTRQNVNGMFARTSITMSTMESIARFLGYRSVTLLIADMSKFEPAKKTKGKSNKVEEPAVNYLSMPELRENLVKAEEQIKFLQEQNSIMNKLIASYELQMENLQKQRGRPSKKK